MSAISVKGHSAVKDSKDSKDTFKTGVFELQPAKVEEISFKFSWPGFLGAVQSTNVKSTVWNYQFPASVRESHVKMPRTCSLVRLPIPSALSTDMVGNAPPAYSVSVSRAGTDCSIDKREKAKFLKLWPCKHLFT